VAVYVYVFLLSAPKPTLTAERPSLSMPVYSPLTATLQGVAGGQRIVSIACDF